MNLEITRNRSICSHYFILTKFCYIILKMCISIAVYIYRIIYYIYTYILRFQISRQYYLDNRLYTALQLK